MLASMFYEPRVDWTYPKMRSVVLFFGIAPAGFLCAELRPRRMQKSRDCPGFFPQRCD